jgi:hypothetical protein
MQDEAGQAMLVRANEAVQGGVEAWLAAAYPMRASSEQRQPSTPI